MSLALGRILRLFILFQRAYRQFNVVMFMKESYKIAIIVLFITETIMYVQ